MQTSQTFKIMIHALVISALIGQVRADIAENGDKGDTPIHALEFPGIVGQEKTSAGAVGDKELNALVSPKHVIYSLGPEYRDEFRKRAGEPSIERAPGGRLWAAWCSSPIHEDRYRHIIAATSGDDGMSWDLAYAIDDNDGPWQIADSCLWLDPEKRLWHIYWQAGPQSLAVAMMTETPDSERPVWSEPRVIATGTPINKPIVTSKGEWILLTAIWPADDSIHVNVSNDKGKTWTLRGTANIPKAQRNADEPMIIERKDGSLWLLARTLYGIGASVSHDDGRTWDEIADWQRMTPARFFVRRLASGNLLLVRHGEIDEPPHGRENLMAFLSEDDGKTWKGGLELDGRGALKQQGSGVSYPDGTQAPDGRIYVIHDYNRWDEKEIVMHVFMEEDVLARRFISKAARQNVPVNKAKGINLRHARGYTGYQQRALAQEGKIKEEDRQPPRRVDPDAAAFQFGPRACFESPDGEVRRLIDATQLFSNRPWIVQELPRRDPWDPFHPGNWPNDFLGFGGNMQFIFSSFEHTEATCTKDGMAYVFTPAPDRSDMSVEKELLAQGFEKTSEMEFYLFVPSPVSAPSPSQATTVYQKKVKAGETVSFGQWGVLVF